METEVHARNWSFVITPSSTVTTNLSRKATSATTGLMLFTIKRAKAIQTFLDMTSEIKCEFGYYGKDCTPKRNEARRNEFESERARLLWADTPPPHFAKC